jgi:hypothetical protein
MIMRNFKVVGAMLLTAASVAASSTPAFARPHHHGRPVCHIEHHHGHAQRVCHGR